MASMRTSMRTAALKISGLASDTASRGVYGALNCIHGVTRVRMVPEEHYVTVTYDVFRAAPQQFETAVGVMGCKIEQLIAQPDQAPAQEDAADTGAGGPHIAGSELTPA